MSKMFVKQDGNLFDILNKNRSFFGKLNKVDTGYKNEKGKVSKCWEWQGACFQNGYGRLGTPVETKGESIQRTHRYAFYLANGKIKKDLLVLHKCDNRICCNPKHLYQGDHRQNMRDMTDREQQARGETSGRTIFTEADIVAIRFFNDVGFPYSAIMEMYDSAKSTIGNIINRRVWDHVDAIELNEKNVVKYIASRRKRKCPLIAPKLKNFGAISSAKQCEVNVLRTMSDMIGQIALADALGSTRKKLRVALALDPNTLVQLHTTGSFTIVPAGLSPHRIVELIQSI